MDVLEVPQSTFDARCLSVAYCWTALNEHECVGLHRLVYHREGQYRRHQTEGAGGGHKWKAWPTLTGSIFLR